MLAGALWIKLRLGMLWLLLSESVDSHMATGMLAYSKKLPVADRSLIAGHRKNTFLFPEVLMINGTDNAGIARLRLKISGQMYSRNLASKKTPFLHGRA